MPLSKGGRRAMRIYRPRGLDAASFRRTCLNVFIPQALALLGNTLLHAACVRVGDKVLLFGGQSGLGKSTLAAGFSSRGYDVFSDDVIRVESENVSATAFRGYSGGYLRAGSFLLPTGTTSEISGEPKCWFDFGNGVTGVSVAPVAAFYFLGRSRQTAVKIEEVGPAGAVHVMLRSLLMDGLDREQRGREALRRTTKLVAAVPVYSLKYRRDSRHFDAVLDAILAHAQALVR